MSLAHGAWKAALACAVVAVTLTTAPLPAGAGIQNDAFGNAIVLSGTSAVGTGSNVGASTEPGEPAPFSIARTLWYRWTSPFTGPATVDTEGSGFDTEIAVYTGSALNNLSLIGADDDGAPLGWSRLGFSATAGVTYRIQVDGFASNAGSVSLAVNRRSFTDVLVSTPFWTDIEWAAMWGVVGGFPNGSYRPNSNVTRAAMSAFLYRLASNPPFSDPVSPTFSDVPTSHIFFTEIEWMNFQGITTGFPGGVFKPGGSVTREAMAAFLHRFRGEPSGPFPDPGFSDVPPSHVFRLPILWMADSGVTTGFADGTFRPGLQVLRGPMAAFMHRFAELP